MVKTALYGLRIYLLVLLTIILISFIRFALKSRTGPVSTTKPASAATSQPASVGTPPAQP
jgi:hypothetical protein